jgi:hypothetical protein
MEYTIIIKGYSDLESNASKTLDVAHEIGEKALLCGASEYKVVSIDSDLCWDSRKIEA